MNIALLEPYYGGSHKYWADHLIKHSSHSIELFSMQARHWKWRMQGSAIYLADLVNASTSHFDLFLLSDMIDLALLRSQIKHETNIPFVLYMHENQLHYPKSRNDKQAQLDLSYGYLNFKSCLAADAVVFNSHYHKKVFLDSCYNLLKRMPDYPILYSLDKIESKSSVLPLGLQIIEMNEIIVEDKFPETTLLWNHRWDDDKNPQAFLGLLDQLDRNKTSFKLCLTSQSSKKSDIENEIEKKYRREIIHNKYIESKSEYFKTMSRCHFLPVMPGHDYFGISVLEAVYCGVTPLLPQNMVYEEHLPISQYPDFFYETLDELPERIANCNSAPESVINAARKQLRNYDWKHVINDYDNFLTGWNS